MSDLEPESFAEFVTEDGPGSAENEQPPPEDAELMKEPEPVNDLIQRSAEEPDEGSNR